LCSLSSPAREHALSVDQQSVTCIQFLPSVLAGASASRYLAGTSNCAGKIREALELNPHALVVTGETTAGTMVLLYDHIVILPDEYRFVWKAKLSFAKYTFLLNRYVMTFTMLLVLPGTSRTRKWMVKSSAHEVFNASMDSDL
jgi:hypothetical protein